MHPLSFDTVREKLLQVGIAPRHVSRYVVELREHMADLVARERANGLDAHEAQARARVILGTDAQLAQAMLDRSPPRSWAAKASWLVFGITPVVAIIAVNAIIAMVLMRVLMPVKNELPAQMAGSYQVLIYGAVIFTGYVVGPLLAAGAIAIALRQRLASAWVWIGLAVIALFTGFFAFHAPDAANDPYRATQLVMEGGRISGATTLAWVGLRASVLFVAAALAYRALKARQTLATG